MERVEAEDTSPMRGRRAILHLHPGLSGWSITAPSISTLLPVPRFLGDDISKEKLLITLSLALEPLPPSLPASLHAGSSSSRPATAGRSPTQHRPRWPTSHGDSCRHHCPQSDCGLSFSGSTDHPHPPPCRPLVFLSHCLWLICLCLFLLKAHLEGHVLQPLLDFPSRLSRQATSTPRTFCSLLCPPLTRRQPPTGREGLLRFVRFYGELLSF